MRKNLIASGTVAAALVLGAAGVSLVGPSLASAADPTAAPAATATAGTTGATGNGGTTQAPARGSHGGPGGLDADDLTAAANALGMTEADLTTALNGGKTPAQVAADKGVDLQKVIDAIVAADKAEFAAAVTAGTMTQAQADQMIANLPAHVADEVNGIAGGPGGAGGHGGGMGADDVTAAAKVLGMTDAELTTALQGGKTTAQVAADKGVDVAKVIAAIEASDKAEFAAAVKAGTMTQAEADARLANLTAHVTDEVNGVAGGPGGHGGHGPDGQAPATTSGSGSSTTGG